jgi:signal transduction histidine kinase
LERAEALQRERARLARDLHDDLGANLTGLALKVDAAQRQLQHDGAGETPLLGLAPAARRLVDQLREVIWTVNPQCDTVENFAAFVAQDAEDFLAAAGVSCRLDLPDTLPATPLDSAVRHHLRLVVKEALHNAVKHAAASEVTLGLRVESGELRLSVADDGVGMRTTEAGGQSLEKHGNGLANMRSRVGQLGGKFECASHCRGGTRVTVVVPLSRTPKRGVP